jgi:hypothetical protein
MEEAFCVGVAVGDDEACDFGGVGEEDVFVEGFYGVGVEKAGVGEEFCDRPGTENWTGFVICRVKWIRLGGNFLRDVTLKK